jgi:putative hydrolase of the HAD superfamily
VIHGNFFNSDFSVLMPNPGVLFFDAGNTLVHLDHPFLLRLCADRGVHSTEADLLAAEYVARKEVDALFRSGKKTDDTERWHLYFRTVLSEIGVAPDDLPGYVDPLTSRHRELNLWSRLLDGTGDVLDQLAGSGYRLGVISNSDGRIEDLFREVGILHHFEIVVDSGRVGVEKPEPEIFRIASSQMGVEPEDALYIGDIYEIDIVGAWRAGMQAVMIDPLDQRHELGCPRITSILELPRYLGELERSKDRIEGE